MSKFVGKFRKHKDYKDDYIYAKDFLKSKRRRSEMPEVKKKLMQWDHENHEYGKDENYNEN